MSSDFGAAAHSVSSPITSNCSDITGSSNPTPVAAGFAVDGSRWSAAGSFSFSQSALQPDSRTGLANAPRSFSDSRGFAPARLDITDWRAMPSADMPRSTGTIAASDSTNVTRYVILCVLTA